MAYSPQNTLRVFISSAQREEKGFDWAKTRRKIKDKLGECPYISPFIIEDDTCEIPSSQLFTYQVTRSDLIVMLFKGELRPGTATEFSICKKYKKPVLIYFFKDDNPSLDITKIRREIEKYDICTYCGCLDPLEAVEERILHDIIENTIQFYLVNHGEMAWAQDEAVAPVSLGEISPSTNFMPAKSDLAFFRSCYETIYDLLGLKYLKRSQGDELSEFHDLGEQLLRWLILGERIRDVGRLSSFIEKEKEIFHNVEWLIKRWDAFKWYMNDDISAALRTEEDALELARKSKLPEWICHEILIDCRNLETIKTRGKTYGKHQEELDRMTSFVCFPVADRALERAYNSFLQENISINTLPHGRNQYGNNFREAITNFENYFFISAIYGSFTHLTMSRRVLGQILYSYGRSLSDVNLKAASIYLFLLNGETKEYKNILLEEWDSLYSLLVVNSEHMFCITDRVGYENRDSAKQVFLSKLGLYLCDKSFGVAENYLINFAPSVTQDNAETYFDCITSLLQRLDHYKLFKAVMPIISEGRFNMGGPICHFLLNLDFEKIPDSDLMELSRALNEKLKFIMERNGEPQLIAYLMKHRPQIFQPLYENPDNGLVGMQKHYYALNMGTENWIDVLDSLFKSANIQYEKNKSAGSYTSFRMNSFSMIADIVEDYFSDEIAKKVTATYFPICGEILANATSLILINQCLCSLRRIVAKFVDRKYGISLELQNAIEKCKIHDDTLFMLFTSETMESVEQNLKFLKVLAGVASPETLFEQFYEYPRKGDADRKSMADCILSLLRGNAQVAREMMVLSVVLQFCEDKDYLIRLKGMECLTLVLSAGHNDMAERQMIDFTTDPAPLVRNSLLNACTAAQFPDKELADRIIDALIHDANFAIKQRAQSMKERREGAIKDKAVK